MSERDRVTTVLSRNSSVSSFSRPTSTTSSVPHRRPAASHVISASANKKCSVEYDNGTGILSPRLQAQIDAKNKSQRSRSLSASLNKPLPVEPEIESFLPSGRESFTLADVSSSRAQPGRAAYVRSMAASTHIAHTTMSPTHLRNSFTDRCTTRPSNRPLSDKPSEASQRPTHSREPSQTSIRRQTHSRNVSNISNAPNTSAASRTHTFPALAHAEIHSRPTTLHPSTRLLLTHLPQPLFASLSGFLLSALESATLPTPLKTPSKTHIPVPGSTNGGSLPSRLWSNAPPTPPHHQLNHPNHREKQARKPAPHGPVEPFCQRGAVSLDEAHAGARSADGFIAPRYGAVGATRALWMKGYRDEAYCVVKPVVVGVLRVGERRSRWEGHWLRRGSLRGLRTRKERAWEVERRETVGRELDQLEEEEEGEEQEGEEIMAAVGKEESKVKWMEEVGVEMEEGVEKLKRMRSTIGGGIGRMASKMGRWDKEENEKGTTKEKEKRVYKKLPLEQDHSGWYTSSDDDD